MNLLPGSGTTSRLELGVAIFAALALPAMALAGDLGAADLGRGRLHKNPKTISDWNPRVLNIQFQDGRLSVNGSIGIVASQVKYFQRERYRLYVFYNDSNGKPSIAGFSHSNFIRAAAFFEDFLGWWLISDQLEEY